MGTISQTRTVAASLRALLEGLIDYAGLFPPAALDMQQAVANYARYLEGENRWALGRFIVAASRLEEFRLALGVVNTSGPWRVSAIVGTDAAGECESIRSFNREMHARASVDVIEVKAASLEDLMQHRRLIPEGVMPYFEVPPEASIELLRQIAAQGGRAKIRTGGLVAAAFPSAEQIARFITDCAEAKVAFKATAGLHHPLRCVKPLTYEPGAAQGTMHGFLNVFLAACVAGAIGDSADTKQRAQMLNALTAILLNDQPANFVFQDDKATMRGLLTESGGSVRSNSQYETEVFTAAIRHVRENFAIAFGSCSFEEPIEDLRGFHLL